METVDQKWLSYAQGIIDVEINGLRQTRDKLDSSFLEALDLILKCSGRVVITGMGKSGHIGLKISATMASTGTPAYFIHPAEASHGDLGMLTSEDLLVAISNSGESSELSDILLFSKDHHLPIIAITKNAGSALGQQADIVLELPDSKEACPLDRAPTTSTTATLALGDALAMTLMNIRDFKEKDFVKFHPGGKLGATLLSVQSLIERRVAKGLPLVKEDDNMEEIVLTITKGLRGHAGVTNRDGNLVGIISDGDLRRAYNSQMADITAVSIMSRSPKTVGTSMLVYEVRELLELNKISAVFVVDGNCKPIGLLHLQELLQL